MFGKGAIHDSVLKCIHTQLPRSHRWCAKNVKVNLVSIVVDSRVFVCIAKNKKRFSVKATLIYCCNIVAIECVCVCLNGISIWWWNITTTNRFPQDLCVREGILSVELVFFFRMKCFWTHFYRQIRLCWQCQLDTVQKIESRAFTYIHTYQRQRPFNFFCSFAR